MSIFIDFLDQVYLITHQFVVESLRYLNWGWPSASVYSEGYIDYEAGPVKRVGMINVCTQEAKSLIEYRFHIKLLQPY